MGGLRRSTSSSSSSSSSSSGGSSRQHTRLWLQPGQVYYLQPTRLLRYRPAARYRTALENMLSSKYFEDDEVEQENSTIAEGMKQLSMMSMRFVDFDLAGKEMYKDKAFLKRLGQSDDPDVREHLRANHAHMLDGDLTMKGMFEGLRRSQALKRQWLEEEQRVISDPVKHQAFLAFIRQTYNSSVGAFDMSELAKLVTPEMAAKAQRDPKFMMMLREIVEDPTLQTFAKWIDHPNMGAYAAAVWNSVQAARSARGQL